MSFLKKKLTPAAELEIRKLHAGQPDRMLKAEQVVEAARPEDSPLHEYFDWDDAAAAHQHRLNQARRIIVSYTITLEVPEIRVPAAVSLRVDRGAEGGGYRLMEDVVKSADLMAAYRLDALKDLDIWCERYKLLRDIVPEVRQLVLRFRGIEPQAESGA